MTACLSLPMPVVRVCLSIFSLSTCLDLEIAAGDAGYTKVEREWARYVFKTKLAGTNCHEIASIVNQLLFCHQPSSGTFSLIFVASFFGGPTTTAREVGQVDSKELQLSRAHPIVYISVVGSALRGKTCCFFSPGLDIYSPLPSCRALLKI